MWRASGALPTLHGMPPGDPAIRLENAHPWFLWGVCSHQTLPVSAQITWRHAPSTNTIFPILQWIPGLSANRGPTSQEAESLYSSAVTSAQHGQGKAQVFVWWSSHSFSVS